MREDGRGGGKGGEADEVDLRPDGEDNMPGEWEQHSTGCRRFMSWTPVVQNLLGTGFLSRLLAQYAENETIILN